jgi:DNA-binding CsgD family transcriptional regulator
MSFGIARRVIAEFREKKRGDRRLELLTPREYEVLDYLSKGYSTRQVAKTLFISYETVRCHQKNIYTKLHVNSSLEAVAALHGKR